MSFKQQLPPEISWKIIGVIILICALFISKGSKAKELELGVGYHQVQMKWLQRAEFKHKLVVVEGTYWLDSNVGLRAQYAVDKHKAKDVGAGNFGDINHYMSDLYSIQALYKYKGIEAGVTYNAYKECYDNAVGYADYCNSDDDYGLTIGYSYKLPNNLAVRFNYNYLYYKDKLVDEEITTSLSLTLTKTF